MAILHDTMADFSNNPSKSIPSVVKITIMYCCKLHRCRRSYCLCKLRNGPAEYRECAKGGFGPEAPLLHHLVAGEMRPQGGGEAVKAVSQQPVCSSKWAECTQPIATSQ